MLSLIHSLVQSLALSQSQNPQHEHLRQMLPLIIRFLELTDIRCCLFHVSSQWRETIREELTFSDHGAPLLPISTPLPDSDKNHRRRRLTPSPTGSLASLINANPFPHAFEYFTSDSSWILRYHQTCLENRATSPIFRTTQESSAVSGQASSSLQGTGQFPSPSELKTRELNTLFLWKELQHFDSFTLDFPLSMDLINDLQLFSHVKTIGTLTIKKGAHLDLNTVFHLFTTWTIDVLDIQGGEFEWDDGAFFSKQLTGGNVNSSTHKSGSAQPAAGTTFVRNPSQQQSTTNNTASTDSSPNSIIASSSRRSVSMFPFVGINELKCGNWLDSRSNSSCWYEDPNMVRFVAVLLRQRSMKTIRILDFPQVAYKSLLAEELANQYYCKEMTIKIVRDEVYDHQRMLMASNPENRYTIVMNDFTAPAEHGMEASNLRIAAANATASRVSSNQLMVNTSRQRTTRSSSLSSSCGSARDYVASFEVLSKAFHESTTNHLQSFHIELAMGQLTEDLLNYLVSLDELSRLMVKTGETQSIDLRDRFKFEPLPLLLSLTLVNCFSILNFAPDELNYLFLSLNLDGRSNVFDVNAVTRFYCIQTLSLRLTDDSPRRWSSDSLRRSTYAESIFMVENFLISNPVESFTLMVSDNILAGNCTFFETLHECDEIEELCIDIIPSSSFSLHEGPQIEFNLRGLMPQVSFLSIDYEHISIQQLLWFAFLLPQVQIFIFLDREVADEGVEDYFLETKTSTHLFSSFVEFKEKHSGLECHALYQEFLREMLMELKLAISRDDYQQVKQFTQEEVFDIIEENGAGTDYLFFPPVYAMLYIVFSVFFEESEKRGEYGQFQSVNSGGNMSTVEDESSEEDMWEIMDAEDFRFSEDR